MVFLVATRKLKIIHVIPIIFLLDTVAPDYDI